MNCHHYAKTEFFFLISLIKKKKSSPQFYAGFVWFLTFFTHNYLMWRKFWKKVWLLNIKMLYTKNNFTLALWQNDTVHKSISMTVSLLPQQTDIYSSWIHWPLSSGIYGRTRFYNQHLQIIPLLTPGFYFWTPPPKLSLHSCPFFKEIPCIS